MSRRYVITRGEVVGGLHVYDGWKISDMLVGKTVEHEYTTEESAQAAVDSLEAEWEKRKRTSDSAMLDNK